jgi:hypothetical protein
MILMVQEQLGTQLEWIFYSMVCFLVFHFESRIFTMSLVVAGSSASSLGIYSIAAPLLH